MFISNGGCQFKCPISDCPGYVTVSQSTTISESFRLVVCPVGHQLRVATCRVRLSPDGTSQQQSLWPCPTCKQVKTVNWMNNPKGVTHGNYRCSFCAIEFPGPQLLVSDRTSISQVPVPASAQTALETIQHAASSYNATASNGIGNAQAKCSNQARHQTRWRLSQQIDGVLYCPICRKAESDKTRSTVELPADSLPLVVSAAEIQQRLLGGGVRFTPTAAQPPIPPSAGQPWNTASSSSSSLLLPPRPPAPSLEWSQDPEVAAAAVLTHWSQQRSQRQDHYEIKRCTCGHILSSNSGKCEKCGRSLT